MRAQPWRRSRGVSGTRTLWLSSARLGGEAGLHRTLARVNCSGWREILPPIPALVGYVRRSRANQGKQVANAAAWLEGGKVVVDYAKILLPFYDVFDESRYFEPGASVCSPRIWRLPRGHYHLRRRLERQAFLDQSPLHPRSGGGMRRGGSKPAAEHRLVTLQHGKNPIALRHAEDHCHQAANSRGLREPRRGKRPTAFRWLQPGL